jgi:hypothetical protein
MHAENVNATYRARLGGRCRAHGVQEVWSDSIMTQVWATMTAS